MIPVLLGVVAITFALAHANINLLISEYEGRIHTPQARAAVLATLHLNGPFIVQYLYYIGALFTGQWGFTAPLDPYGGGRSVLSVFEMRFPPTAELALVATFITIALSIPIGVLSAVKKDRPVDHATRLLALFFVSIPTFWFAYLVLLAVSPVSSLVPHFLRLNYPTGQINYAQYAFVGNTGQLQPWVLTGLYSGLTRPTGFLLVDTLLYGDIPAFLDGLKHLFYPAVVVGLTSFGYFVRFMRSSMLETLGQDYIRTAKSKGIPTNYVIKKHARRNSFGPTTTIMGLFFAGLLGGVVVVEVIYGWPGMGTWLYEAAIYDDLTSIVVTTFIFAIVIVVANLIVDVLYAYLDPRVRLE